MKYLYLLLVPLLFYGCTKNNQNQPSNYAYLNVNQTYTIPSSGTGEVFQTYDINNDGQVDWGFNFNTEIVLSSYGSNYNGYVEEHGAKILPVGFTVNGTVPFSSIGDRCFFWYTDPAHNIYYNPNLPGSGDFYIGFKSQNPTFTNTFYGWARLNLSQDFHTVVIKDMAINTINGGSINVGQH